MCAHRQTHEEEVIAMGLTDFLRTGARLFGQNGEGGGLAIKNLEPTEVAELLKKKEILLIDVRERGEYAAAHIKGARLVPLSTFDPHSLPDANGKRIVLHCAVGGRSARALAVCRSAGLSIDSHMRGGINAWIGAGLPIER